ncbi:MAG TPA: cytochrome c oxidase subunit II [Thioalkalivibrio sp.]|nr:cytochrome c oxidase subunit II [Thioalkalivibrio sp.]
MSNAHLKPAVAALSGAALAVSAGGAVAAWEVNMPQGVTEISRTVYDLHMLIFWICVVIGIVVFGAMFYSIVKHRKSKGHQAAQFHESTTVEVLWTLVPFLILVGMAIPATKTLIAMEDTSNADMTIKVTGYQWKWHYDYMDEGIGFFSNLATSRAAIENRAEKGEHYLLDVDNPIVVPVNKKIRFLVTANDVIHAFWVPDLAMKKDAIPGFVNELWTRIDEPGVYRGQCAELCGKDHGFMPIVVVAMEEPKYLDWVAEQKAAREAEMLASDQEWGKSDLMARGEKIYNTNCAACHQANGEGMGSVFPAIKGSAVATGSIQGHIDLVMNGVQGTAMAAYGPQLGDVDLAAVLTYQRNAFGNDTGDVIQPTDIKAAR